MMLPNTGCWTAKYCWVHAAVILFILLLLVRQGTTESTISSSKNSSEAYPYPTNTKDVEETIQAVCSVRDWIEVRSEFIIQQQQPTCAETRWGKDGDYPHNNNNNQTPGAQENATTTTTDSQQSTLTSTTSTGSIVSSSSAAVPPIPDQQSEQELDTDSPLDKANFLSFEDWKKQNLAKVGQSAENVGGNRRVIAAAKEDRRRPTGINNALDSLGDDAEIELDFGGFGAEAPDTAKPTAWGVRDSSEKDQMGSKNVADGKTVADSHPSQSVEWTGTTRRHDAGITCKERFNYASFDCAATVLKTNPECKGSSSVLIENKDSYMLNECRAQNKFLILELCDDILVDTVVLANYEFFSSIFRTFRVSVSDRYPAKPDQWKELGVYEARNTREVQAFAVENPLIWARYLKIELLTHYGNEFYCPLSLIRVHGTTMMEEYKHDGEAGRIDEELGTGTVEPGHVPVEEEAGHNSDSQVVRGEEPTVETDEKDSVSPDEEETCPNHQTEVEVALLKGRIEVFDHCPVVEAPAVTAGFDNVTGPAQTRPLSANVNTTIPSTPIQSTSIGKPKEEDDIQKVVEYATPNVTSSSKLAGGSESVERNATSETEIRSTTISKEEQAAAAPESTRPTVTQPPSPNPTTQESFFKSVNKRLQMLESNSTLSLLYIEEQSRILRDAFSKVEKRQLAKTLTFLENLNVTVRSELKQFREQYEEVWESVAFEFEDQRVQYHKEIYTLSTQLGVLADELVFQKRVSVIQSIMVLFCFGLVLFSHGPVSNYIELPSVQNMVSRSYSLRSSSPVFGSRSRSPSSTRQMSPSYRGDSGDGGSGGGSGHRRNISEDSSQDDAAPLSPSSTNAYDPRTPTSDGSSESELVEKGEQVQSPTEESMGVPAFRSESSPPVLTRTDDDDDDGEEDEGETLQSSDGV